MTLKLCRALRARGSRLPIAAAAMTFVCLASASSPPALEARARRAGIAVQSIPVDSNFPDAVQPGTLQWACAPTEPALRQAFASRQAPFDPALVRREDAQACHVDYTPTMPGFRADPDDLPVRELVINVDNLSLVARRQEQFGDALDISARILAEAPRSIPVTLGKERRLASHWYALGAAFRYGQNSRDITWRQARVASQGTPWTQDFLKSGRTPSGERILVTRNLFEGRASDAPLFAPMLDSLSDDLFVRSHLSWEGGDLQFVRHPGRPDQIILVFGSAARQYWGESLTDDEYAYVLRREFGADLSIDVSGITPHADYFASFLPAEGIVLLSEPITGNRDVALAAAELLEEHVQQAAPEVVRRLREELARPDALPGGRRNIRRLVDTARREASTWDRAGVIDLYNEIQTHVHEYCRDAPASCFDDDGIEVLLREDPALLRAWLAESRRARTDDVFVHRLLDIVESQVEPVAARITERSAAAVRAFEEAGFRVVRVPRFGSDQNGSRQWAGVSYANNLLIDDLLYVPTFGLGAVEQRLLDALDAVLPARYRVVPVFARHMLLNNGGVHCTVAIVRDSGVPRFREDTNSP
jgi:hypothetical protein